MIRHIIADIKAFTFDLKHTFFNYNKSTLIVLLLLFSVNIILRINNIASESLWYDEAHSVFYGQQNIEEIKQVCGWDINPPGYLLVLKIWIKFFGISEFSVRILSLIFTGLSSIILFLFASRFLNKQTAMMSSLLFLISFPIFYYSQEARGYTLNMFMVLWSSYILFDLIKKPNWTKALLLGVLYGFMIYTHYLLSFVIIIQFIFLVSKRVSNVKFSIPLLIGGLIVLFEWIKRIMNILSDKTGDFANKTWIPNPDWNQLKLGFYYLLNNQIIFFIIIIVFILAIGFLIINRKKMEKVPPSNFIYLLLLGPGIVFIHYYMSEITPMWVYRYFLYSIVFMILIFSYVISLIPTKPLYKFLLILSIGFISFYMTTYEKKPKMQYKEAVEFVNNHKTDNTIIIQQTKDLIALFSYYYSPLAFKNYHSVINILKEENIFLLTDSTGVSKINFNESDQVILLQTFKFADPQSTLYNYLDSNFELESFNKDLVGVHISLFKK